MNQENPQPDPSPYDPLQSLADIRRAREQAKFLRDQLLTELEHINREESQSDPTAPHDPKKQQFKEAMRKAITVANHGIACIDKALQSILNKNKNQKNP